VRVEKLQGRRTECSKDRRVGFHLPEARHSGAPSLVVRHLGVAYDSQRPRRRRVRRGPARACGRGGTQRRRSFSLQRCLASLQPPGVGAVELGHSAVVGYFTQEYEQIDPERTVVDNIDATVFVRSDRRSLLGSFSLTAKIVDKVAVGE
jgi:ATPase subunit of ABC transporter with duplicated ATPase domains